MNDQRDVLTTSFIENEICPVNSIEAPYKSITDRSKEKVLLWLHVSVGCFDVSFGDVSPYECTEYLYSGYETEWLRLGKELLTRYTL